MLTPPDIEARSTIASTRLFEIETVDLHFSNGERRQFERLQAKNRGAVLVVPVQDSQLLLVREYAVGVERYELGFVKGVVDDAETIVNAANRELMEEAGMQAGQLQLLGKVVLSPCYMGHVTHIVLAQDLSFRSLQGDEPERPEVVWWPLDKLDALSVREDFSESRSFAALWKLQQHLQVAN